LTLRGGVGSFQGITGQLEAVEKGMLKAGQSGLLEKRGFES
jgi:hypothetical protein